MPEWVFSLDDKMSASLRKIGDAHENLEHKAAHSHSVLEKFAELEIAEKAIEGAKKIYEWGEAFVDFVVEVHDAEAASKRLLDVIAGGKGEGTERFEELKEWAKQTKFTVAEVIGYQDKLFSFTKREGKEAANLVLLAASDLSTLGPGGKAKADALVQTFASMGNRAKVTGRALIGLSETGVISQRALGEAIAQELGIKGPKAAEQGLKQLETGVYDRTKAMNLALKAVNKDVDFGKGLGTASLEQAAGSVTVQIKNVKQAWEELFEDQDVTPLSDAIGKVAHALDKTTPTGQALGRLISEAFADVTKVIDFAGSHMDGWIEKAEKALHMIEKVVGFVEAHPGLLKVAGLTMAGGAAGGWIGATGGLVAGTIGVAGENIREASQNAQMERDTKNFQFGNDARKAPGGIVEIAPEIDVNAAQAKAEESGSNLAAGLAKGFSENLDFGKLVEDKVIRVWDAKTETHSPSRVFDRRGEFMALGVNQGFARRVNLGIPGLGGATGAGFAPTMGGSAGGHSIQVTVPIVVHGAPPQDSREVEAFSLTAKAAVRSGVMQALEEMAAQ